MEKTNTSQMDKMREARKFTTQKEIEDEVYRILHGESLSKTQIKQVCNVPIKYRLSYARSLFSTEQKSKALALKMKCYECMGFESVADRIRNCGSRLCPLWLYRPFQNEEKESVDELD